MADEVSGVDWQIGFATDADRQIAEGPFVGQLDPVDGHTPQMTLGGGCRDDPDADIALDQSADRVKAAQLHPQFEAAAASFRLLGEKALQRACPVEADKIEIEGFGERDLAEA